MKNVLILIGVVLATLALYLTAWPVPVEPVAWEAPENPGFTGVFAPNSKLADVRLVTLPGKDYGPEDIALDRQGRIYTGTEEGNIVRYAPDGTAPEIWVNTGGRPLGIDFDARGNLIVADAYLGLLSIAPDGKVTVLSNECDGKAILFADDLDIANDGQIYFSDASTKFGVQAFDGVDASRLEVVEQGRTGRLLVYDPATKATSTLLEDLSFANGVALSANEDFVLVNETGRYRVTRYWLKGPRAGESDVFFGPLPGFPDNIDRGPDGRFWVALVSPRNKLLDDLAGSPFLRKLILRLPKFLQPNIEPYLHIVVLNADGSVHESLQDPDAVLDANTSVYITRDTLYLGSLHAREFGILKRP